MTTEGDYSLQLECEGAGAEVFVKRDWEGQLEMEISGITGRTFVFVDLAALEQFRNFLDDVIKQESGKAEPAYVAYEIPCAECAAKGGAE